MKRMKCPECGSMRLEATGLIEWSPTKDDWIISALDPDVYCHDCGEYIDEDDLVQEEINEVHN